MIGTPSDSGSLESNPSPKKKMEREMKSMSQMNNNHNNSNLCRRGESRRKLECSKVTCWTSHWRPHRATPIECDEKGARLLLPWNTEPGDSIKVSICDELGQYQTKSAIVVWASPLNSSKKVVAGLAFTKDVAVAA